MCESCFLPSPFIDLRKNALLMAIYSMNTPSISNRLVCPALGKAGLWESSFPKKMPGSAWVTCRLQIFNPNLNPILQIKVNVDTSNFRCCDRVA